MACVLGFQDASWHKSMFYGVRLRTFRDISPISRSVRFNMASVLTFLVEV